MKAFLYILLCLGSDIIVAYGDYLSKKWTQGFGLKFFFSAYLMYMIAVGGWFGLIKVNGDVGRSTLIWCAGGIAMSMLIGFVVFGETLTFYNKLGMVLSLAGVVLMTFR